MENKTKSDDGAFAWVNETSHIQYGLTKREYFAAIAMQGLLTRIPKRQGDEVDLGILEAQRIASESRIMADLLIKELNLEGGDNE